MFSRTQRWILSACAVVIVLGGGLLLFDRFFVRGDQPSEVQRRAEVIEALSLEEVRDPAALEALADSLQPFTPLIGRLTRVEAVLRQPQPHATLWLVAYQSRQRDAALDRGVSYTGVDAPRLLLLIELAQDPGWQPFMQTATDEVPAELPPSWHARLAAMAPYRMAIDRGRVAFVSQLQGSALVQSIQARTSPEFHPGLLNSALRVEVQQALDIVSALPGAPPLERFYRIDVDVDLPPVDRSALDRAAEQRHSIQAKLDAERAELRTRMAEQQEAFRQRNEENLARFRERMEANNARLRARTEALREQVGNGAEANDVTPPDADIEGARDQ